MIPKLLIGFFLKKIMVTAIVAARMGSGRFPGKVLEIINGKPIIQHVVDFLNKIKSDQFLDDIIIATPNTIENEKLWNYLKSNNIKFFKGSNDDVLDREELDVKIIDISPKFSIAKYGFDINIGFNLGIENNNAENTADIFPLLEISKELVDNVINLSF